MPKQPTPTTPQNEDWFPLEQSEHEKQLRALAKHLGKKPARILDLGIGDARTAAPLVRRGHTVVGVDHDPAAVWACAASNIACINADFLDDTNATWNAIARHAPFDAAVCLGNTFLTIHNVARATALLTRLRAVLKPGGQLILDDFAPLWREVAEGYWQEGLSEDKSQQLIWASADNALAIRRGKSVKPANWKITKRDRLMRLWSKGELELLAMSAGWTTPTKQPSGLSVLQAPSGKRT
jgi:SAM-dependent methyltransferase